MTRNNDMSDIKKGSCVCKAVTFEVKNDFTRFYQCHCKQCQQMTGSAFAANIFTSPNNITWLSGRSEVTTYNHPTRSFTQSFCIHCGCPVPHITQSGKALIIPAGSLTDLIEMVPDANIFTSEEASWLHDGANAKYYEGFPENN